MSNSTSPHEIWRPIPGYEGLYSASDRGRIRTEARRKRLSNGRVHPIRERIRALEPDENGYLRVVLTVDNVRKTHKVHHLVALAFVGPRPPGAEIRHLNGNPADNRPDNLRWGTRRENRLDTVAHGNDYHLNKDRCPRGHLLAEPNLVPSSLRRGARSCLACKRTSSLRREVSDFQSVSDDYYRAIMGPDLGLQTNLPDD